MLRCSDVEIYPSGVASGVEVPTSECHSGETSDIPCLWQAASIHERRPILWIVASGLSDQSASRVTSPGTFCTGRRSQNGAIPAPSPSVQHVDANSYRIRLVVVVVGGVCVISLRLDCGCYDKFKFEVRRFRNLRLD